MKVLNLDSLSKKESREVVINGVTHAIKPMSVEDFIETTKDSEKMGENPSFINQLEMTISILKRSVPTLDKSDLQELTLEQLRSLADFVQGVDPDEIVKQAEESLSEEEAASGK